MSAQATPRRSSFFTSGSTGDSAELEFSAGSADGSGAAPDGSGKGQLNEKGELEFTFDDSFGNKGTGAFSKKPALLS